MTASLPVIEYAKELQVSEEKLYRALALSNLVTIQENGESGVCLLTAEQSVREREQEQGLHIFLEEHMRRLFIQW